MFTVRSRCDWVASRLGRRCRVLCSRLAWTAVQKAYLITRAGPSLHSDPTRAMPVSTRTTSADRTPAPTAQHRPQPATSSRGSGVLCLDPPVPQRSKTIAVAQICEKSSRVTRHPSQVILIAHWQTYWTWRWTLGLPLRDAALLRSGCFPNPDARKPASPTRDRRGRPWPCTAIQYGTRRTLFGRN